MNVPEAIDNLRNAIPGAETHIYAAGHSFANDALDAYVSDAALPALERSVSFLNTHHS
jgi:carboxymethylenebutenolidase